MYLKGSGYKTIPANLTLRTEDSGITIAKVDIFFVRTKYFKKNYMKYADFERFFSQKRLNRYVLACNGDKRKAMTLYRYNLRLSQEMFTIISCFEVSLRNAIDGVLVPELGPEWLKDSVMPGGIFTLPILYETRDKIYTEYDKLTKKDNYSHSKLLASIGFGTWKYMFSPIQYLQTNQKLLDVFPCKQKSSMGNQLNRQYIYNELNKINSLRNRIAHHEPICFRTGQDVIYTDYVIKELAKIQTLFSWMGINGNSMLFGLNHVQKVCNKIDGLK